LPEIRKWLRPKKSLSKALAADAEACEKSLRLALKVSQFDCI
jgi:hypothetical protein